MKWNITNIFIIIFLLSSSAYAVDVWDRPSAQGNVTIINNITTYVTNNITIENNITNNYTTIYNVTNNITNNITETFYITNNITNNITQYYDDERLNQSIIYLNDSIIIIQNNISDIYINIDYLSELINNLSIQMILNDSFLLGLINTKLNQSQADLLYYPLNTNPSNYGFMNLSPSGQYLYNDTNYFFVNETSLNITINNISEVRAEETLIYINTSTGIGTAISGNIKFQITQIIVQPLSNSTKYKFSLYEYPSYAVIDRDRATHTGQWNILKDYSLNSAVYVNITNSNPDDNFTITIKYLNNGLI